VNNPASPSGITLPVISRETFDRLSRIHRAVLLLMAEDGEIRIVEEGEVTKAGYARRCPPVGGMP